ncbi:hypothetical protein MMA231_03117 [Asticcacaulis sp. MM231]
MGGFGFAETTEIEILVLQRLNLVHHLGLAEFMDGFAEEAIEQGGVLLDVVEDGVGHDVRSSRVPVYRRIPGIFRHTNKDLKISLSDDVMLRVKPVCNLSETQPDFRIKLRSEQRL